MVATINEHTQYFSETTNTPIVNGFIYIGARNGDPRVPIPIFSDRELTTPLANPQRTDSAGRSINKIWIPGRYSIEVSNSNDVQKYLQIDVGESSSASVINLGNVQGANDITATGTPTITSYDDLSQFTLRTVQANTGAMTLNVDGIGEVPIKKNHNEPIQKGNFEAVQNIILTYNLTDDVFEWTNQNLISVASYNGTSITSASTIVIPTDGDFFKLTGTTTIDSMTVDNDRQFELKSISGMTITNSASIVTPNGEDIEFAAGDTLRFQSTSANIVQVLGSIVVVVHTLVQPPIVSELTTTLTTSSTIPLDDTIPQNTEGAEVLTATITPKDAANILEITINGFGASNGNNHMIGAFFRDSAADAVAAELLGQSFTGGGALNFSMRAYIVAGSLSATTFKFRAGANAGTLFINSNSASSIFSTTSITTMTIKEYLP